MKIRDVKVRILLGILLVATILIVTVIMAAFPDPADQPGC